MAATTLIGSNAIGSTPERELAKLHWPDLSPVPDLACDACWGTHCIFEAVITGIDKSVRIPNVAFDVVRTFSDAPRASTPGIVQSAFSSKDQSRVDLVSMAVGERFLMFCLRNKPNMLFVERIPGGESKSTTFNRLTAIARLRSLRSRKAAFSDAIRESAFDPDPIISEYCLRQLLEENVLSVESVDVARLQKMADNYASEAPLRLLAAQIAFTVQTGREYSEEEYEWLWQSFESSPVTDAVDLRAFVKRIWKFPHNRPDKIRRLLNTAESGSLAPSIRLVACHPLLENEAFHYREPDEWSDRIVQTILGLLADPNAEVRSTTAGFAQRLVTSCRSPHRRTYRDAVIEAIKAALARETDKVSRFHLEMRLERLETDDAPPLNMNKTSRERGRLGRTGNSASPKR